MDKEGDIDRITLKIEILKGREGERKRIEAQLKDQLRLKTNLGYNLEFHDYGTLPRYDVKAKRFKDLRGNIKVHGARRTGQGTYPLSLRWEREG